MDRQRIRAWVGGYVRSENDGRETFIIERRVGGQRFHVSTRTHTEAAAVKQLARFEADPFAYRPEGDVTAKPLLLTYELIMRHRKHSIEVKKNTRHYANEVAHRLVDWQADLSGRDLRRLQTVDLRVALEGHEKCRKNRIVAIKSFYGWLRRVENLVAHHLDPTRDLSVPQSAPEKGKRRKAVAENHLRAVFRRLKGSYRDVLELLTATGLHVSELQRFIRDADSQLVKTGKRRPLAVLMTRHKTGIWTRTPLNKPAHVRAADRLKRRGSVPRKLNQHLKRACEAAGVPAFTFGVMRHSVATIAVQRGATPDQVAAFLHHRDKRTTERFYVDVAEPTNQVPVLDLGR